MRLRILRSARAASLGGATSQLLAPTVFSLRSRLSTAAAVQVPTNFVDNIITAISISRWVTIGQKIYELWDDESVQNHQTVALRQALRKRSPDAIATICCKSLNKKQKNQNPSLPRNVSSYSFLLHSCPILIISDPKTKATIQMSSLMPAILSQNKQEWGLWIGFFVHWCLFNATRMSQYAQLCWRDVLVLFTLVQLLSCALWRRSRHAISWADFPPKHKSAVSPLFLSRPPSLSSVSLKYLQSELQRLSVSFRYFLFFFTCGEKWGICLFREILTKGSESFGTGFQSPDSPALVVLSPYRCWANCNYQWEPTLTHFLSKKGILLFGVFWCSDYIQLMNPIHYAKVRPVPCPCCCCCCFIFSCLLRNANPEFQLSPHNAMCVCLSVTHREIFLFFAADFPPFRSVLLVVPPGHPHHPHISSLLVTSCHFS